jgi:histidine triad (HIT) family protein
MTAAPSTPSSEASPGCLFCKIARGEIPATVVREGPLVMTFLDHRPLFPGHCLVIPRAHAETLGDLPADLIEPLFAEVQIIARAVEQGLGAGGTFVALNNRISQSVPHLHVHVVPRRAKDGLKGFFWPRQKYESDDALKTTAASIRNALP